MATGKSRIGDHSIAITLHPSGYKRAFMRNRYDELAYLDRLFLRTLRLFHQRLMMNVCAGRPSIVEGKGLLIRCQIPLQDVMEQFEHPFIGELSTAPIGQRKEE
ncbi:unknown [Eggerthella sp. CAG:298]|nr:unknown [Eggerthella sp. CAG:298]